MTHAISVADSILTSYLQAGLNRLDLKSSGLAVIETGRIAAYPDHRIHPDVGISVRDRGLIALQSPVRADELNRPVVWIRTSGPTAELVARATIEPYFGFRVRAWVGTADGNAEAVVVDEMTAIAPFESGYREDLSRAWFVLTGLPLVTHVLAVPAGADPAEVGTVAGWFANGGELDEGQKHAVRERIAAESGADPEDIHALLGGIRWTLAADERRSVSQLFARSGVSQQVGPIRWYRHENEPEAASPGS